MADSKRPDSLPDGVFLIEHPLIAIRLTRIRDRTTSTAEFRQSLHEIGGLMVFEMTRHLETRTVRVETPLAETAGAEAARPVVLVPILRAGLGMLQGVLPLIPEARIGHIGMARDEETLRPATYYCKLPPDIGASDVILIDPMLATGNSAVEAARQLIAEGAQRLHFVCLIACHPGIAAFKRAHPAIPVYVAAIDPELNEVGYIVPGLGDAGDRYFGTV